MTQDKKRRPLGFVLLALVIALLAASPFVLEAMVPTILAREASEHGAVLDVGGVDFSFTSGAVSLERVHLTHESTLATLDVRARTASLDLELLPLFTGSAVVEAAQLDAPEIRVRVRPGSPTAATATDPGSTAQRERDVDITLGELVVHQGSMELSFDGFPAALPTIAATAIEYRAQDVTPASLVRMLSQADCSATLSVDDASVSFATASDPRSWAVRGLPIRPFVGTAGAMLPGLDAIKIDVAAARHADGGAELAIHAEGVDQGMLSMLAAMTNRPRIAPNAVVALTPQEVARIDDLPSLIAVLGEAIMSALLRPS